MLSFDFDFSSNQHAFCDIFSFQLRLRNQCRLEFRVFFKIAILVSRIGFYCCDVLPTLKDCSSCGGDLKLYKGVCSPHGCRYVCRKNRRNSRICNKQLSVRTGTWFEGSWLTIMEMVFKFYYYWIMKWNTMKINTFLFFSWNSRIIGGTGAAWILLASIWMSAEVKLSINGTNFVKRSPFLPFLIQARRLEALAKPSRSTNQNSEKEIIIVANAWRGSWFFGRIEWESEKCFLVLVGDRKTETLIPIIQT